MPDEQAPPPWTDLTPEQAWRAGIKVGHQQVRDNISTRLNQHAARAKREAERMNVSREIYTDLSDLAKRGALE